MNLDRHAIGADGLVQLIHAIDIIHVRAACKVRRIGVRTAIQVVVVVYILLGHGIGFVIDD